ncbi:hypothetical protein [Nonomuraea rhizosphaerae]|uniref:hypothetical protein n=1 Tax=Nonomuraea rhizosphaerae TaxID=2665663 RepID=UPI001C60451F|nr:hypothetical protein [Nonomuraea rhizosphaerae]
MSMYERQASASPGDPYVAGAPRRSPKLPRAVYTAITAAVFNLIGAAGILVLGTDAIRQQVAANQGAGADPISAAEVDVHSERFEGLQTIYSGLAYSTIFWSLVLILLAWLALRGGTAVRVIAAIILIFSVLFKAADLFMSLPVLTLAADVAVVGLGVAAIVLLFGAGKKAGRRGV